MKNHILVVDADLSLRNTYISALQAAGFSAAGAGSAQSAIRACELQIPDVVILELQLHSHSGVEFLHELRSYAEWQDIPVILHTLVAKQDLQGFDHAFKTLQVVGYAYKPETSLKKLVGLVGDIITVKT